MRLHLNQPLVPTLLRGNAYRGENVLLGMDSHGGPWEPEHQHTVCVIPESVTYWAKGVRQ